MRHILFSGSSVMLSTALLIKDSSFNEQALRQYYIDELTDTIPIEELCAFTLQYESNGKVSAKVAKEYLQNLLTGLVSLGITTVLVADSTYFKYLTKSSKAEPHYGYILDCALDGFTHIKVILSLNHQALFYNPTQASKLEMSLNTLKNHYSKTHVDLGLGIIHHAEYPDTLPDIQAALDRLLAYPALSCDIESTSLRFNKARMGSIGFAWDQHNGIAFPTSEHFGVNSAKVDTMLRNFFDQYTGTLWFHNALFDVKHLIYTLYMSSSTDYSGMLTGLSRFNSVQDTQILVYLATNSTAQTLTGLKPSSFEFTGNYALEEIKDITIIPKAKLLKYNLTDCLATWYVHDKYLPIVIADEQEAIYKDLFQPSIIPLVKMMLTGLPMDLDKVQSAKETLQVKRDQAFKVLMSHPIIKQFTFKVLRRDAMIDANSKLKTKIKSLDDFNSIHFNPGSDTQLRKLLYSFLMYEPIDYTKGKQPATGAKTIAKLAANPLLPEHTALFKSLIEISKIDIILTNFIKNFQELAFIRDDDTVWLNGDLVLGGTQSGRLSSKNPNMQNIPSNSTYAKLIKECFIAPEGWLFGGADFSALEDRIGAILSGDPNKTREFSEGIDGHSLRTLAFFSQLQEPVQVKTTLIDPANLAKYDITDVNSVNLIKEELEDYRQEAKAPSFA